MGQRKRVRRLMFGTKKESKEAVVWDKEREEGGCHLGQRKRGRWLTFGTKKERKEAVVWDTEREERC